MARLSCFFIFVLFLILPNVSFAHGGGLNSAGCHNETRTGGYHCHRGSVAPPSAAPLSSSASNQPAGNLSTKEVDGTFDTSVEGVVFKNVKCVDKEWVVSLVNRNAFAQSLSISFFTVDDDGDPLHSFNESHFFLNTKSRKEIAIENIDCNVTPFNSIKNYIR